MPRSLEMIVRDLRQWIYAMAEEHREHAWKALVPTFKPSLHAHRNEHLLPDEQTQERVLRYETHLTRLLHRNLHELQRLQARRLGQRATARAPAPQIDG